MESRTRAAAEEVLLRLLPETTSSISDPSIRSLLSPELLREVFALAWRHQFEDDRTSFERYVKDIVVEATAAIAPSAKP